MNIIKKLILISVLILPLTLVGCFGPGTADYNYNLSENYILSHTGETYIVKKDDGYNTYSDISIDRDIQKVWWNDNFICAIQKNNNELKYWIIDISTDELLGPFKEETFNTKIEELNISKDVKFKNPEKFKDLETKMDAD